MTKGKIIIAEDDLFIAENLKDICEEAGYEVVGIVTNYKEFVDLFQEKSANVALLDIRLEGNDSGIDIATFLRTNEEKIPFIFITSFSDQKTIQEAINNYPQTYIVKPYAKETVIANLSLAMTNYNQLLNQRPLLVNYKNKTYRLNPSDIFYIEASENYVRIHLEKEYIPYRIPIAKMEGKLPPEIFTRIHKSYIINKNKVTSTTTTDVLLGDISLPIGRTFRDNII